MFAFETFDTLTTHPLVEILCTSVKGRKGKEWSLKISPQIESLFVFSLIDKNVQCT